MQRDSDRGSLLVEAIAAVAVVSVTLAIALSAISDYFRAVGAAQQKELAISLLASKLEELGVASALEEGVSSGELSRGLGWRLSASRIGAHSAGLAEAFHVAIEAQATQGRPIARLETIVVAPRQP